MVVMSFPLEWSTSTDWDTLVSETAVTHDAGTVDAALTTDSFEDDADGGTPNGDWNSQNAETVVTTRAWDGSQSVRFDGPGAYGFDVTGLNVSPTSISYVYQEAGTSYDHAFYARDGNGNDIVGVGSNNPQVMVETGNGSQEILAAPSPDYDTWRRFTLTFDWANDTVDILWEDLEGSTADQSLTDEPFITSASQIVDWGLYQGPWSTGVDGPNNTYVDEVWGVYGVSSLITAEKTS